MNIVKDIKFTLHSATIKIRDNDDIRLNLKEFTLHSATIKIILSLVLKFHLLNLHYTLLLLKYDFLPEVRFTKKNLHYTLLLLKCCFVLFNKYDIIFLSFCRTIFSVFFNRYHLNFSYSSYLQKQY